MGTKVFQKFRVDTEYVFDEALIQSVNPMRIIAEFFTRTVVRATGSIFSTGRDLVKTFEEDPVRRPYAALALVALYAFRNHHKILGDALNDFRRSRITCSEMAKRARKIKL